MASKVSGFPSMVLKESEKTDEWCNSVVDAIVSYMSYQNSSFKNNRHADITNYNIYNGNLHADDFKYITEQYGMAYPARLVNYPIIQPKIDLLVGEELRRPTDLKVATVNKEAVLRKEDKKVGLIMRSILDSVHKEFEEKEGFKIEMDGDSIPLPEDIDLYMRYNYKEMVEETAQDGLEYLVNRYNYKDLFKEGFRDLLVTGKEFYKVDIIDRDPQVRRIDPRAIVYDIGMNSDYLDDATWVGEERWLSLNEIVDEYRDELDDEDVNLIAEMSRVYSHDQLANYNSNIDWVNMYEDSENRIRVITCEWKSVRSLRFKISENKYDPSRPFKKLVDDDYKPRKNEVIETRYVDDIWEATKIGGRILVRAQRRPNQVRSVDDAGSTSLSYIGVVRNNTTGRSLSMVDLLKNVQMLYNIVMYHIELAMARSGGKAVVYDTSQLPTNLGMDMQTVLYHLKTDGIIPINSKEEGGQMANFNQFQQIDFTLSQSVQQLINLKLMLEQTAGNISGVSPQREGAVGQYEYVGNVQRSVVQSATITESWFYSHIQCKKRIYERLCNLMKLSWAGGKKAAVILGDGAYKFLNVMPDIALQDFGVHVGDSGKDDAMRQAVQQLSQAALQSGQISLLDVIKVMKADTMTEAEHVLERGMDEMKKQMEVAKQQEQEMLKAQAEAAMQEKQADAQIKQLDNETSIKVAEIGAQARVQVAEIASDDKRDIADMKERVAMDKEVLKNMLDKGDTDSPSPSPQGTATQEQMDAATQTILES